MWGARPHNAAGELIGRLVEIRAGIIVYSTDMFQLATTPLHARKLQGEMLAQMERQRFGLRSSARVPPEASGTRRMFQVFDVDWRAGPSGTSSLCELWPSWQLEGQLFCFVLRAFCFHLSCSQQRETILGSRCAAEVCLQRTCRPYKPMPTLPSCKARDSFACRFPLSESSFQIDVDTIVPLVIW